MPDNIKENRTGDVFGQIGSGFETRGVQQSRETSAGEAGPSRSAAAGPRILPTVQGPGGNDREVRVAEGGFPERTGSAGQRAGAPVQGVDSGAGREVAGSGERVGRVADRRENFAPEDRGSGGHRNPAEGRERLAPRPRQHQRRLRARARGAVGLLEERVRAVEGRVRERGQDQGRTNQQAGKFTGRKFPRGGFSERFDGGLVSGRGTAGAESRSADGKPLADRSGTESVEGGTVEGEGKARGGGEEVAQARRSGVGAGEAETGPGGLAGTFNRSGHEVKRIQRETESPRREGQCRRLGVN